ncbi:tetratricopeptide repeat protein [Alishewanella sp. HL-SH05]|uniref:tetratricopeptide repeat protein n=1 Tax=Alishewanella sp. HL-SH05 TaxID=3461145 RepID=UPI0040428DCB
MFRLFSAALLCGSFTLAAQQDVQQQVQTLWQKQAYQEAKSLLTPLVNAKTKDAALLAALGRTELSLGNVELAEKLLARALKNAPEQAQYQFWYGQANCESAQKASMFSALSAAKRCAKAFATAVELAPDNAQYLQALAKYYAQAPSIAGGDKEQALQLSKQLQLTSPLQGQLLELELLLQLDDPTAAQALLAKATELQTRPEPYFLQGVKFAQSRDYEAAIEQFAKASAQPAVDKEASRSRLLSLYQLGRAAAVGKTAEQQGIRALERFLEAEGLPEFREWAQFRLGQLYLATEQRSAAEAILKPLQNSSKDSTLVTEIKKIL